MNSLPISIIKVGGSLFDLPDLGERIAAYLNGIPGTRWVLFGGGAAVDSIRDQFDAGKYSERESHWLSISAMKKTAQFGSAILKMAGVAHRFVQEQDLPVIHNATNEILVIECENWLRRYYRLHPELPESWDFTSDSIAALLAIESKATEIHLLKSRLPSDRSGLKEAMAQGLVDCQFLWTLKSQRSIQSKMLPSIRICNLREDPICAYELENP